jgi:mRNA interferase MazF
MKKPTGERPKAKKSGDLYQPDRGHFVHLNFTPHAGIEQAGPRPALVLSPLQYNIGTGLLFACPVTSQVKGSPFEVPIPRGARVTGVVLSNQLRSVDWLARQAAFLSVAPNDLVLEVLARIEAILQITLDP